MSRFSVYFSRIAATKNLRRRLALEKWRYGRQEERTQRRESRSQLGSGLQVLPSPDHFNQRILGEAAVWLDRIQEAYETEVKYDRIEAIQKLLPQWKTVVEQARKSVEALQQPTKTKSLALDLALLCSPQALPPLVVRHSRSSQREPSEGVFAEEASFSHGKVTAGLPLRPFSRACPRYITEGKK